MSWDDVFKLISAAVISIGGGGALICLAVKFFSESIAESLAKKYEHNLAKILEEHKSKLEHKNYVSKTRFDTEFAIYRELSKNFFMLVEDMNTLFPICSYQLQDQNAEYERKTEQYEQANRTVLEAQRALYRNAAFMPQRVFDEYKVILNLCNEQFIAYRNSKDTIPPEVIMKTEKIQTNFNDLNNTIRDYLSKLDVLD